MIKPPKIDPLKLTIKTLGKHENTATAHTKKTAYTLTTGKIEQVYSDLSKFMYSIGKISNTTMKQIQNELFKR